MNKYVIYTVMTGGYNKILQPLFIDKRFDYILFSNDFEEHNIGIWEVRHIPEVLDISMCDNKRLSRYPKTHPEIMLAEYTASLYIDANVQIADGWIYDRIIELVSNRIIYAGIKLVVTGRDCIYEHSFDMCAMRAEHDYNAIIQCHELFKRGFPEHYGLNENNIIYRFHSTEMQIVDDEWWQWIVNYSPRDQFSFMYCLWKYSIPIQFLLPIGEDSRNSKHFNYISHNNNANVAAKKWVKMGFIEKLRNKNYIFLDHQQTKIWVSICKSNHPQLCLNVWGIWLVIENLPQKIIRKLKKLL